MNRAMFWGSVVAIPLSIVLRDLTWYVVVLSHVAITYSAYLAMGEDRIEAKLDDG